MRFTLLFLLSILSFNSIAHEFCTVINYAGSSQYTVIKINQKQNFSFVEDHFSNHDRLNDAIAEAKKCDHVTTQNKYDMNCTLLQNGDDSWTVVTNEIRRCPNTNIDNAAYILSTLKRNGFCI